MEFRLNREAVPAEEVIYSGVQEQGVELDYILPDYYPDIVRLVRCDVIPVVSDWSVSGDRLTYELRCEIRLLYCGEDGSELRCVTQKQDYSKTVELGRSTDSPEVTLAAKSDHINFRAVNKRRLDVRGAVSVRISVRGEHSQEVVSDAFGMNIQLKRLPCDSQRTGSAPKKLSSSRRRSRSPPLSRPSSTSYTAAAQRASARRR